MFDASNDGTGEGASDDKPIVLEGYKQGDFDALLRVMLPQQVSFLGGYLLLIQHSLPELTKDQWVGVLKLSTIWQMDKIRAQAVEHISALHISPIEKIQHARAYRVSKWLKEGVGALAVHFAEYTTKSLAVDLGWETIGLILLVRERAKLAMPEANDWINQWHCCSCGSDIRVAGAPCYVACSNTTCRGCLLVLKNGASKSEVEKVPDHIISTVFEQEIVDLDAS
ncbi:hypothetical protein BKA70DRAFT_1222701 [Coprinopsis sp. MPI-PUGE-AT-0042]|nr:hypothetical protein BKA70DRAFT_1222701 [Coprinopsis sp. MPI-PUGE-AT-0042]